MELRDKVIPIWMICYDGDADRIYSFTDFEKAVASVEGSVRGYFGDDTPEFDRIAQVVTNRMHELRDAPCVPMRFENLNIVVYNWQLDSANPIHRILSECHGIAEGDLKEKITKLFEEPRDV